MGELFNGPVPFVMDIDGDINGEKFAVHGTGVGDSTIGTLKGKWVCTTGKIPISWKAIAGTLGYGSKVFVQYPDSIVDFFKECFPGGYSQDRVVTFECGGELKGLHKVTLKNNVIHNQVTLTGVFGEDSPVINDGINTMLPPTEYTWPFENGVKSIVNQAFPLKNGGFFLCKQVTVNKPLLDVEVKQPVFHHTKLHIMQLKDDDESADHVHQQEIGISYVQNLFGF